MRRWGNIVQDFTYFAELYKVTKPRPDSVGGGACIVWPDDEEWLNSGLWAQQKMSGLELKLYVFWEYGDEFETASVIANSEAKARQLVSEYLGDWHPQKLPKPEVYPVYQAVVYRPYQL